MANPDKVRICSLAPGYLATVSSESIVRVWDTVNEESYLLSLTDLDESLSGDKAVCVAFNEKKKVLAVGTLNGKLAKWKMIGSDFRNESDWHTLAVKDIKSIT